MDNCSTATTQTLTVATPALAIQSTAGLSSRPPTALPFKKSLRGLAPKDDDMVMQDRSNTISEAGFTSTTATSAHHVPAISSPALQPQTMFMMHGGAPQ